MKFLNLALAGSALLLSVTAAQAENIKYDMPKHPRVLTVTTNDGTITAEKLQQALRVTSKDGSVTDTQLILSFNHLFKNMFSSTKHMIVQFSTGNKGNEVIFCDVTYREDAPDASAASFENCGPRSGGVYAPFDVSRQVLLGVSKDVKK